jgi:hypothetical protein
MKATQVRDANLISRFVARAQADQRVLRSIATKYRNLKTLYAAQEYMTGLCGESVDVMDHAIYDLESEISGDLRNMGERDI